VFCILIGSVVNSLSQNTQPAPTPPPTSPRGSQNQTTNQNQRQDIRGINAAFDNLRSLEIQQNAPKELGTVLSEEIQPLYRKPSKKELKNLLPSQSLLTQYEKFLKQSETGIFKLSADSNCAVNPQVVVATEKCLSNDIPGAGTAYSFRVKSHRILHLSDLVLDKNVIRTGSLLQQGVLVNLGNIELDEISTQTVGLKYLFDLKPVTQKEELANLEETLSKGVKSDGFIYSYGLYIEDKTTFALRSVAYRSKVMRSVSGVKYDEFDYDKRKDIVVVFRVVEKDENGDLTILWKEIARKDSPVIKIDEKNK
ncbi:MAG: hypothetical protein AAB336_00700, partial [Acidobacteriota bacterium]